MEPDYGHMWSDLRKIIEQRQTWSSTDLVDVMDDMERERKEAVKRTLQKESGE